VARGLDDPIGRDAQAKTLVRVCGPKGAPPLVLLPGMWQNSLEWLDLIAAFAKHHRVYAVDNPWDFGLAFLSSRTKGSRRT